MSGEHITAFKTPQLYRHHKGSTFVVLQDNVIDTSHRFVSHPGDERRLVLYTNGSQVFVRDRDEFFGVDPDTNERRFTPVDNKYNIPVLVDPDMDPGTVRMVGEDGSCCVEGVNIGGKDADFDGN